MSDKIRYRRDLWKLLPKGAIVAELGVAEGNFSEDIVRWPCEPSEVHLVDRWMSFPHVKGDSANSQEWHDKNYAQVCQRMKPFVDRVHIVRNDTTIVSTLYPNQYFDLVYIDADHSYEGVRADIASWRPKVKENGLMAFHDFLNPAYGVRRAVEEFCMGSGIVPVIMHEDKDEDAGAYFIC